jgi:hypothetical protein
MSQSSNASLLAAADKMSPTPPLETYPDVIPIIDGVVRNASDPENAIAIEMAAIMMAAMVSSRERRIH